MTIYKNFIINSSTTVQNIDLITVQRVMKFTFTQIEINTCDILEDILTSSNKLNK